MSEISVMKLGTYNQHKSNFEVIRDLTLTEVETHTLHTKIISEARNRLALFRMLERNYQEFQKFVNQLLSANWVEKDNDGEEIDRLILNYLTFAYSIQEHFRVSMGRRFEKLSEEQNKYSEFIDLLCKKCKPFAFILDFRGFVQHVGLGVGNFERNVSRTSVEVKVTADPERLTRESREWKRSGLKPDSQPIDLIEYLYEFHIQMLQSYGSFVAKVFFPELVPASEFYAQLTEEAKRKDAGARMVFFHKDPDISHGEGGKVHVNMQLVFPPNSLFEELGIKITRPPPK